MPSEPSDLLTLRAQHRCCCQAPTRNAMSTGRTPLRPSTVALMLCCTPASNDDNNSSAAKRRNGDRDRLLLCWMIERECNPAMIAIDREIGVECQDGVGYIDFSHPHNTGIGQRHRPVPIFLMQLAQGRDMFVDAKRDLQRTIFDEPKQRILCPGKACQQSIVSASTGSQTRSGGSNVAMHSITQR